MIQGSYEDVMGVHYTDNTGDWLNLQKLLFPSTVDAAVIHTIRASGVGYLGIKWAAYRSSPLATVRDCCVLEMVGYTKDHHGRDLGYSISFSLDLPECPEVVQNDKHFMRMRHFSATLIAECRDVDSTTEIFVVGSNEMLGTQGSNALCRLYMTVLNDFSLVIDSRNILKQTCVRRSDWVEDHERSECVLCERSFKLSSFRRRHHCRLCGEVVCARCLVTRTVPNVIMGTKVKLKKSKFCVRCVVNVRQVEVKCETYADRVQKANRMRLNGRHSSIASSMSSSISASLPTGVSLLSSSSFSEAEPNPANDNSGQRESSLTYHRRVSRPLLKISSINEKSVLLDDHDFIDMDDVDLRLSKSNASRTPKDTSTAKDDAGRAASSGSTTSTASTGRSSLSRKDSFQSLSDFYSTLRRLSQPDPVAP
ncbi:TPA: hypothetical protein N0F65_001391 [Lagenidium giganteum]|uniref:FYVE-type domain-containing protein n=1 Tax=Lagenidium giganteum TaxID=4803 RepID=A0AAV2Z2E3_9STRA|nr:TPA: hypothetical protein N0F65_001391 [Lagenidium giganteum]